MANSRVVIVIFHHSSDLKWYERIALQQCRSVLGGYPMELVCPEGTDLGTFRETIPNLRAWQVPRRWMSSVKHYNFMKKRPALYRRYQHDFDFLLTYELDALVFRDELPQWLELGYDFVGAPWVDSVADGLDESGYKLAGVGNSGFSLRNIHSALRVISHFGLLKSPLQAGLQTYRERDPARALKDLMAFATVYNTHWAINFYPGHEDRFFSLAAARQPWFKVPSCDVAARFAFEKQPGAMYDLCGNQLPFGCHAWHKFQLDFWRPHVEAMGYSVPASA